MAVMPTYRSVAQVEAELIALRAAAERAGVALACLFSSSDEFEAAVVRQRQEAGTYALPRRYRLFGLMATAFLTFLFLLG